MIRPTVSFWWLSNILNKIKHIQLFHHILLYLLPLLYSYYFELRSLPSARISGPGHHFLPARRRRRNKRIRITVLVLIATPKRERITV